MIISASVRTDIPAFYGRWFQNRLEAGFCRTVNPFNSRQHSRVSLAREDVDGFVFWTKNVRPFLPVLGVVRRRGYPFILQYTINGYPQELESRVVDARRAVDDVHRVSDEFGRRVVVWRYDTILLTTRTPEEFHLRNMEQLAEKLEGTVDEVVVSFAQFYKKTERNLSVAAKKHGFEWTDPDAQIKRRMLQTFAEIASSRGMVLSICTQPELLVDSVQEAKCVDADRLADVSGKSVKAKKQGMRPGCGCFKSRDIGAYDTCPHGCVYCYAVRNRELALARFKQHDPEGEYLYPVDPPPPRPQLGLFPG